MLNSTILLVLLEYITTCSTYATRCHHQIRMGDAKGLCSINAQPRYQWRLRQRTPWASPTHPVTVLGQRHLPYSATPLVGSPVTSALAHGFIFCLHQSWRPLFLFFNLVFLLDSNPQASVQRHLCEPSHIVYINRIDSHHHPNEHTILYVFRAPGYDSLVSLNWYKQYIIFGVLKHEIWVL